MFYIKFPHRVIYNKKLYRAGDLIRVKEEEAERLKVERAAEIVKTDEPEGSISYSFQNEVGTENGGIEEDRGAVSEYTVSAMKARESIPSAPKRRGRPPRK